MIYIKSVQIPKKKELQTMTQTQVLKIAEYIAPIEFEIIHLVTEGVKVEQIAKRLHIHEKAVERHIAAMGRIMREVCNNV